MLARDADWNSGTPEISSPLFAARGYAAKEITANEMITQQTSSLVFGSGSQDFFSVLCLAWSDIRWWEVHHVSLETATSIKMKMTNEKTALTTFVVLLRNFVLVSGALNRQMHVSSRNGVEYCVCQTWSTGIGRDALHKQIVIMYIMCTHTLESNLHYKLNYIFIQE